MRRCSFSIAVILGSLTWPLLRGWSGPYRPYSELSGSQAMPMGPMRHALELALDRRRHIGTIFLDLQLHLDANVFEIALHQLHGIEQIAAIAHRWHVSCVLKPLGNPASASKRLASLGSYR